jgi:cell wall-associated NlpC family hydrolase
VSERPAPDRRLHAYRQDLASETLRGLVVAARYVEGALRQVHAPLLPLRREPRLDAPLDTEALFGETLLLFDEEEGWAWAQLSRDGYVGYVPSEGLRASIFAPTHRIAALRSYVFPVPDIKAPPISLLSMNATFAAKGEDGRFLILSTGGFVPSVHARRLDEFADDFVDVAAAFAGTPYLWGGRSSIGVDCSGLVQLACESAGIACPRDADMQAASLGDPFDLKGGSLKRGDLVFWDGHVGIMADATTLLHASAYQMAVVVEPLAEARARIAASGGGEIVVARRLPD